MQEKAKEFFEKAKKNGKKLLEKSKDKSVKALDIGKEKSVVALEKSKEQSAVFWEKLKAILIPLVMNFLVSNRKEVISYLQKMAEKTDRRIDDLAVHGFRSVLELLAEEKKEGE